jgi:hypothetical protein
MVLMFLHVVRRYKLAHLIVLLLAVTGMILQKPAILLVMVLLAVLLRVILVSARMSVSRLSSTLYGSVSADVNHMQHVADVKNNWVFALSLGLV